MNCKTHTLKRIEKEFSIHIKTINYNCTYDFDTPYRKDYFEILLFKTGNGGSKIIDFEEYKIIDRCAFIITPGQVRLLKCDPKDNGICIQFTREFLELSILPPQLNWFFKFLVNPKIDLDEVQFGKLYFYFEKIKELYQSSSTFKLQKLQKLFGLIFFKFLEIIPNKVELNAKEYVPFEFMSLAVENFRKIRLVKKYAELLNISVNNLEKQVKKHFGRTPLSIINELLVIEIKRLLLVEKFSHKEITFILSFDSQASYTRFVKTHTNMTPTKLKEVLRKTLNLKL
ncbi:AraC family transcriptional regulator [Aquimarina sp. AU474]|uniref:helix-turn-helix domain-containing protein n=1 Tax=Aquimarina sp. AU474 TaxID=2108529 RepID=UPI000D699D97|nr:helix-turn-helix domain-containing protein [Aquimarina sp. AU474]